MLKNYSKINIDEDEIHRFLNGIKIEKKVQDGVYRIYNNMNQFLGTAVAVNERIKRDVII